MSWKNDSSDGNVQVAVRIRPLLPREEQSQAGICVRRRENTIEIRECGWDIQEDADLYPSYKFSFDRVFAQDAGQGDVYDGCAQDVVESFIEGFNSSILAYGISSAGKTYTIRDNGIVKRAAQQIFASLSNTSREKFQLTVSYYQIYNETVLDLLNPSGLSLRVRETQEQEIYVENLSTEVVNSPHDLERLMARGDGNRVQAETKLNTNSSRSHAILTFYLINQAKNTKSKLQIFDLAGSERINSSQKERQTETKHINQSLAVLGNVMQQIVQFQKGLRAAEASGVLSAPNVHIGFRNSKLTRILQDSIGGNCKLLLIVCVSPSAQCFFETLNSLKFANRAKQIRQHATINEVEGISVEVEIEKLKCQIQETAQMIREARERGKTAQMNYPSHSQGISTDQDLDSDSDIGDDVALRLEHQARVYEEALSGAGFQALRDTYQRLQQLEQLKADSSGQADGINRLRVQSLAYRDFLVVLTDRLQQKEEALQRIAEEVRAVQAANALLAARVPTQTNLNQPGASSDGHSVGNSDGNVTGNATGCLISSLGSQSICAGVLDYAEKCEELQQLREQFSRDISSLRAQYSALAQSVSAEKERLEQRARELIVSPARQGGTDAFSAVSVAECAQERRLLTDIFRGKLLPKVQQIQAAGDTAAVHGLRSYVLQLLDAVQNGDLHVQIAELLG